MQFGPIKGLVSTAVDMAAESYDIHLAKTLIEPKNAKLRAAVVGEFPDHTHFDIQEVLEELEEEKAHLNAIADKSDTAQEMLTHFDRYIRSKVEELFFSNNDFRAAQMKRELADQFVIAVTGILGEKGLMSAEQQKDMRRLIDVYDASFVAAGNLKSSILKQTAGSTGNLVDWAEETLREQRVAEMEEKAAGAHPREEGEPKDHHERATRSDALFNHLNGAHKKQRFKIEMTGDEIMLQGQVLFREFLNHRFGMTYAEDKFPHPVMWQVAVLAETLATRRSFNEFRHQDEVDDALLTQTTSEHYRNVMQHVSTMIQEAPYQAALPDVLDWLGAEINQACGVPNDVSEQIERATTHAASVTRVGLPRRFHAWEREAKLNWSDGRNFSEMMALQIGSIDRAEKIFQDRTKQWHAKVEGCHSMEQMLDNLDVAISYEAFQVMYACDEPVTLLLMRDYVHDLGQSMVAMQRNAGFNSKETREGFAALEKKLDFAYASYQTASDWCLEMTDGAYDDFGLYAMMSVGNHAGRHYNQLSEKQKAGIPRLAADMMRNVAANRGIPADLADNPFIPGLYEQCIEYAARDYSRQHNARNFVHDPKAMGPRFSDKVSHSDKLGKRAAKRLLNEDIELNAEVTGRALGLLDNTVAMFPGGETPEKEPQAGKKNAEWRDPQFHAEGLAECLQFFAEAPGRSRAN